MFSHNLVTNFLSLIRMEIFSWFLSGQIWVFKLFKPSNRYQYDQAKCWGWNGLKAFSCMYSYYYSTYVCCDLKICLVFFYKVDVLSKIWLWSSNRFFLYFLYFRGRPKLSKKWYKRLKVCWILSFLLGLKLSTQGCHSKLLRLSYNCSKNLA